MHRPRASNIITSSRLAVDVATDDLHLDDIRNLQMATDQKDNNLHRNLVVLLKDWSIVWSLPTKTVV
ncbi:unnamed protein product [Protopolystoma xenopodis]|uniref:Uncharacterized protein n=1 Tax=Protopolystoma xenopodis TaxID=117903 RepID=A0A448XF35_9PLAT|nr:unnamed protein product [Protopolystoma xenopodis]